MSSFVDFLFKNKTGEYESLLDIVSASITRTQLAMLAEAKAVNMIANAVAKTEVVLSDGKDRLRNDLYYKLNVQPNPNQTAAQFWRMVVERLLERGECIVIPYESTLLNGTYLYIAESWSSNNYVTFGKMYSNIVLTDGKDTAMIQRTYRADQIIHFHYDNIKILLLERRVTGNLEDALSALNKMMQLSNTPIFKYKFDANTAFMSKNSDGTTKRLTIDDVIDSITEKLKAGDMFVHKESVGTSLDFMNIEAKASSNSVKDYIDLINQEVAEAFDIPHNVFNGTIAATAKTVNEFVTFAVMPVIEALNDTLNANVVGRDDYIKGERAFFWIANFSHIDVVDSAASLDKLRGIGFNLDEIREMVGYEPLNTEFSQARALTLNYSVEGTGEGDSGGNADDQNADEPNNTTQAAQKLSKHRERRLRRNGK